MDGNVNFGRTSRSGGDRRDACHGTMYRKTYWPNEGQRSTPKTYSPTPEEYKKSFDPKQVDKDGRTALHLAIIQGGDDDQHLNRIIKSGCDVNATDKDGQCGLHFASERGFTRCITSLVKHGAELNILSNHGYSPLMLAARHNFPKAVRVLLRSGANPNLENDKKEQALHYAVCKGNLECVEDLLANKAQVNHPNIESASPLILATKCCHVEVIKSLAAAGASLDKADNMGRTALHWASSISANIEIAQTLLELGAETDCFDCRGQSPFLYTVQINNHTVLRQLLDAGCDRSTVDGLNGTALALATIKGYEETVRVLLETGDDPDEFGFFGLTPMMCAVFESHEAVIDTLIDFGADPNITGRMGVPPIFKCLVHVCPSNAERRHRILARLIKAGVNVNVSANTASYYTTITGGKNCPLSFAICTGYVSLMRMLLIAESQVSCEELRQWSYHSGAEAYNRHSLLSPIREWLHEPKSLQHVCRMTIRKNIDSVGKSLSDKIEKLPIAPEMKRYVNFADLDQIHPQKADLAGMKSQNMLTTQPMRYCMNTLRILEGTYFHQTANMCSYNY